MTSGPYCSQKFWFLSVNAERRTVGACCSASHSKIDTNWLASNPGQLFNSELLMSEREQMLTNKFPASCENACYKPESMGVTSRRLLFKNTKQTHTDIQSMPEEISLFLGTNCNLTCSYCCKEYSTAWIKDLENNGNYFDDDNRFILNKIDNVILKISQSEMQSTRQFNLILDNLAQYTGVKEFSIAGGEPFLQNNLISIIDKIKTKANICTGLGVTSKRFESLISKLDPAKVSIVVSAENIDKLYEFNRYGNTYTRFIDNLNILEKYNFDYTFNSVLSNLTVFGFSKFIKRFGANRIHLQVCTDPNFLTTSVLPQHCKDQLLNDDYDVFDKQVKELITQPTVIELESKFCKYVTEFTRRRDLSLSVFPETFTSWINQNA